MKLEKLNLRNQKHLDEVFKKLKSLIDEPKMYGQRSGQLIFGSIASYLFTREAQIYWDEFLLKILQIKQLEDYVSLKTANDLLKPFLENFLIGNPIQTQDFLIKIDELFKYKTNRNFHYFIVSRLVTNKIYKFSNIKIGLFEQKCEQTNLSFSEKIHLNNQEITSFKKNNGTYIENDIFYDKILKEIDKFKGQTILEIENFGDKDIAEQKSVKDAEHFINELIFLRSLCRNIGFKIELNIDTTTYNLQPLLVNYDDKLISYPSQEIIYKSYLNFDNTAHPDTNIAIPFRDLAFPLFDQNYTSDILEKLRTAIDWYASSFKTNSTKESFLFCAIGMEALLTNGRDAITKVLSENTAFLIANKDKNSRKHICSQMAKLYSHRSGIAHGGNISTEKIDLDQLRFYLSSSIKAIIQLIQENTVNSSKDLYQYLEDLKFS
jgi:hypothetical protein